MATGDRFDRFTDRARRVLTLAQDEGQRFQHSYIGSEHILLGLVRVEDGVAARVLVKMGVELPKVRTAVEFIVDRGDRPIFGEVGLTPRAKRIIELAIDEARRMDRRYIGTEHLLLGLVREGEGIGAGVLQSLGVNLDKVRHEVVRFLSEAGPEEQGLDEPASPRSIPFHARREPRTYVRSGSPFETTIGFSRAVRVGDRIVISGTAPIWPDGSVDPDVVVQARRCFEIILAALGDAGGEPRHVVRTRMYLVDPADSDAVGRVHGELFGEVRPAATMVVVAALLDPRWKVEIEAEAVLDS